MCSRAQRTSSSASSVGAGAQRDEGHDLLAGAGIRPADHPGDLHRGMLDQRVLDVAGVDVEAAADDQVLLAVDDEQISVLVVVADVAGVEPAAASASSVASGERQYPCMTPGERQQISPTSPGRQRVARRRRGSAPQRPGRAARPSRRARDPRVGRDQGGRLGQSVALADRDRARAGENSASTSGASGAPPEVT